MKSLKLTISAICFCLILLCFGISAIAQTPGIREINIIPRRPFYFGSSITGHNIEGDTLAGDLVMPWCQPCNISDSVDLSLSRIHFTRNSPLIVDGESFHPFTGEMLIDFAPEPIILRMAGGTRGRKYFRNSLTDVTFTFWEGNNNEPRGEVIFQQKLKMNCMVRLENYRKYNYPGTASNKYDTRSIIYSCSAVESD